MGHTAVYNKEEHAIYIFGGQQEHLSGSGGMVRDFKNDLWKMCLNTGKYERQDMAKMSAVSRRMHSAGFMISQYFFLIGGKSEVGKTLNDILVMDTKQKSGKIITSEINPSLKFLKPVCQSTCCAAYFTSRYDNEGFNIVLDKVC